MAKLYPDGRPFPSRFAGICGFSGLRYPQGTQIRKLIAGHRDGQDIGVQYVLEQFVNAACAEPGIWIKTALSSVGRWAENGQSIVLLSEYGRPETWTWIASERAWRSEAGKLLKLGLKGTEDRYKKHIAVRAL